VHLDVERGGDAAHDVFLALGQRLDGYIEPVGPEMGAALGGDELDVHAQHILDPPQAALYHVVHTEFLADLLHVDGSTLVDEGRGTCDHEGAGNVRQIVRVQTVCRDCERLRCASDHHSLMYGEQGSEYGAAKPRA